jgi:outer membrane cobalamin receptor
MEIELKRRELLSLYQSITNAISLMDSKEFQEKYRINASYSIALAKNEKLLSEDIKLLQKYIQIEPDKDFDSFEQERQRILTKLANKDEKGNPITQVVNGNITYSIPVSNLEEWNKEYKKLEEQYKESLEKRQKRLQEIQEFLDSDEKVLVNIYKVKHEQDGIPPSLNRTLLVLFDDGTDLPKRQVH